MVQSGHDTLIRRQDGEALYAAAQEPKEHIFLPHALHSAPAASRARVVAWLVGRLCPPASDGMGTEATEEAADAYR
jgi:hypothetical protein